MGRQATQDQQKPLGILWHSHSSP